MIATKNPDAIMAKLVAGEQLVPDEVATLSESTALVPLGALADERRRTMVGEEVTFVRVCHVPVDKARSGFTIPSEAGEVRLSGCLTTCDDAVDVVTRTAQGSRGIPVTGFDVNDLVALCGEDTRVFEELLKRLSGAGLSRISEASIDDMVDSTWLDRSADVGVPVNRLTINDPAISGEDVIGRISSWGNRISVAAVSPLPQKRTGVVSTGYENVRRVAMARLLVKNVRCIQVDWNLYGQKMAQVALIFGANDVDGVSPENSLEHGKRRTALATITQNIHAASFTPVERNGRFERGCREKQ